MFQYVEVENFPTQPIKNEQSTSSGRPKKAKEQQATQTSLQKRNVKRRWDEDCKKKEEDTCQFLDVSADEIMKTDDCTLFGQMVASQIKKLKQRNQAIAKNRIQNLIFELEMEEINAASSFKNNTSPQE